jgi:L-cysteine S-thiosulfotransferase
MNKLIVLVLVFLLLCVVTKESLVGEELDIRISQGQAVAFDRSAGNCLSCHAISGGELPGEIGPPLVEMKLRYPDRAVLRSQVWDAADRNPDTIMPPYGRHNILTEEELDLVVDFIHSL